MIYDTIKDHYKEQSLLQKNVSNLIIMYNAVVVVVEVVVVVVVVVIVVLVVYLLITKLKHHTCALKIGCSTFQ